MTWEEVDAEEQRMVRNYWLSEGLRGIRERHIVYLRAYNVKRLTRGWVKLMWRLFPQ